MCDCVCVTVCVTLFFYATYTAKLIKPTGTQALFDAATCGDAASLETLLKMIGLVDSVKTQNNSTLTHIVAARGYQGGWGRLWVGLILCVHYIHQQLSTQFF